MTEGQFVAERWSSGWPGKPRRDTIVWEDQGDGDFLLTVWNEFGDSEPDIAGIQRKCAGNPRVLGLGVLLRGRG